MDQLQEYEDEDDEEFYEDEHIDAAVEGVCFHVLTEFNLNHTVVRQRFRRRDVDNTVTFEPRATHPEAMRVADVFADEIQKRFRGSSIKRVNDDHRDDEFHLYIVDQNHIPIAKIGIIGEDYRDRTIH